MAMLRLPRRNAVDFEVAMRISRSRANRNMRARLLHGEK